MPLPTQAQLEEASRTMQETSVASTEVVSPEYKAAMLEHNTRRANEVLSKLEPLLARTVDGMSLLESLDENDGEGRLWITVWHTSNSEAVFSDQSGTWAPTGLKSDSVAAIIRDKLTAWGYKVRSFWNIVIDISSGELSDGFDPDGPDGHWYVGG